MNTERFLPLFQARSVAMIGASSNPRKWGHIMLRNLIDGGFPGAIYPVNPDAHELLGRKVYRAVQDIPEAPDLAVIAVPPKDVLPAVEACVEKGVKAAVVITAGFAELGCEGEELQDRITDSARKGGMILVGPNCNGFMSPWAKLYIDFPNFHVPPGHIAIIGQSGGVMDGLARQMMNRGLGCSLCVASGNEADLHVEDYLTYLADDPQTKVILCYIEGFKNGERFFRIAREVTRKKPVVVFKSGRTAAGARAAASHTASIAGNDLIFDHICRQAGICRAGNLYQMINMGTAFLYQPLPKGRRIAIVTAGGGWGVMAADECTALGLDMVKLSDSTIRRLDAFLPAWWNRGNPVDLVAGTSPDNIFSAVETLLDCPDVDAVVYIGLMPAIKITRLGSHREEEASEAFSDALIQATVAAVSRLKNLSQKYEKPLVVASEHLYASPVQEARVVKAIGQSSGMCYQLPHEAAEVMAALVHYGNRIF